MLKMVIADDEFIVREGIRDILDWNNYGIEIIGEATNGLDALELCRREKVDILFTDVKMPIMDGLQVAQLIKEEGLNVKVIIFSGMQEFEYVKKAITVSAEGYILKPLEKKELIQVVQEVTHQIEVEMNRKKMMAMLKNQIKENHLAAEEKFLRNLLSGLLTNSENIKEKLAYFNIPILHSASVIIGVLEIDDYSIIEGQIELEKQLLMFSIKNVVDEVIKKENNGLCINLSENEYAILIQYENDEAVERLFENIVQGLQAVLGISVSIGISQKKDNASKANLAFKEGQSALLYKFYTGKQSIIKFTDICDEGETNQDFDLYRLEKELIDCVKLGNTKEVEFLVSKIYGLLSGNQVSISYVRSISIEIVLILSRLMDEFGKSVDEVSEDKNRILQTIQMFENIFDLQSYIAQIVVSATTYFLGRFNAKNERVIEEIREIIEKDYMKNLSVCEIAQRVFLSPNYISQIFKKETGETIIDCITRNKIHAAKVLLRETDLKIQQISEMVGYEDSSYFSKVFKKQTGIYPQKYRTYLA